jgi:predicted dehydrogenase
MAITYAPCCQGVSSGMINIVAIGVTHWHSLYDASYLPLLQQMPGVRIVALHDDDAAIAAERAAKVGNPPVYTDYKQMLAETRPDFVLALGRPDTMAAIAHYLLDHGYPFLMEKPMGFDAAQVQGVADKARACKGFAAVPLPYRYQPQITLAQRLIAEGRLGTLSHISIRSMRPTSARYPAWGAPWMLDPAVANGGCLRNLGPHGLDTFMLLTGETAEVTGVQLSAHGLGQPVEDYASVMLRSAGGVVGNVEVSNLFPGQGAHADLLVSGSDGLLTVSGGTVRVVTRAGSETVTLPAVDKPSRLILEDVLARWQRGQAPLTSADDCYRAMRLVDQAYALA